MLINQLRPTRLHDIIGQDNIKLSLQISCEAAKRQNRSLYHILLLGSYGQGKTTLAKAIANEMNGNFIEGNGANINTVKKLLPYLAKIEHGTVLFFDECHRIPNKVQETLFTVLEDNVLFLSNEDKGIKLSIPQFTFIGATTDLGLLTSPFISRFPLQYNLEQYTQQNIIDIIKKYSNKIGINITNDAILYLANKSRQIPRIIVNRLLLIKDFLVAKSIDTADDFVVEKVLRLSGIDKYGFNLNDRKYIRFLQQCNGPVGIKTISASIGLSIETIENTIEPYLLKNGIIQKTSKGRIYTN